MASISSNGSNGHHKFTLNVTNKLEDNSIRNNTSTVSFSFVLSSLGGGWNWEQWGANITYVITINGTKYTGSIANYDGYNDVTLKSGTLTVEHNADGNKTISFVFSVTDTSGQTYTCGNAGASGSMALATIPRYANITSFAVFQRDETSVTYSFSHDTPCDYAWYSIDNGATWRGLSNSNIVSGLSANTTYQFKLRLRRTDSQLTTDSSTYPQTTYNYPHCIESPDFTIGDAFTLKLYNPLGREVKITGYAKSNNAEIFAGIANGNTLTGFHDPNSVNLQYASIPNSQSGAYKVIVSSGNVAMERDNGNIYRIRGNEAPTINAFDYIDSNSAVVAVTGDNTQIVQNKSMLQARFHSATPNYGSGGIQSYTLECNGISIGGYNAGSYDIGVIDSARDVELKLTAYDSRGLSASKALTVKMVAYELPNATIDLQRLNNYEDETYLTVDGSVSSVLGKNTMTIQYRYKLSGGAYGSFTTIADKTKQTLSLDKNNSYIFNVLVTDVFGGRFDKEYVLNKGTFPLFIDTEKNSVGINCFPKYERSLEINGLLPPVATSWDNLTSFDDVTDKFVRSGFYTVHVNDAWYNLINIRHRNGEEDGLYYGMQIANVMTASGSKLQVRNHINNNWTNWRYLQEEGDILYQGDTNRNFSLTEPVSNFQSVEIFYSLRTSGVDYYNNVKVHAPQGKRCSLFASNGYSGNVIVGMGAILLNEKNVSFLANGTFYGSNMQTAVTGDELYISKVVGYR